MFIKKFWILFFLVLIWQRLVHAQEQAPAPKRVPEFGKEKLKGVDTSNRREFTDEELSSKFFKKKANNEKQQVYLPVFYEGMNQALSKVKAQLVTQGLVVTSVDVDAIALIANLEELVVPKWTEKLNSLREKCKAQIGADKSCMVPLSSFTDSEVKVLFNEKDLEIRIRIPPELRAPRTFSLTQKNALTEEGATNDPSWFSSYVNINAAQTVRSGAAESTYKDGRDPITGRLDSATHFGDLIIEANGRYLEHRSEVPTEDPPLIREDVRAVVDFPKVGLRTQVGDLLYPVKGFQIYRPMAGASVFTQYSLQPSQLTLPGNNYEVFLTRPSKVKVLINNQLVQILDLPAGRHRIQDFPFGAGQNDIDLEITDDTGVTETKKYSYFSSTELLQEGLNEVSYSVGSPWTETNGTRIYDSKQTTISAFHRFGLSQHLTLGGNFQSDSFQQIAGMEFLFSTSIGNFSIEPAYSLNKDHDSGVAGKIRYVMQDYFGKEKKGQFFAAEVSSFSSGFAPLGDREAYNTNVFRIEGSHSRAISKTTNLNFAISYQNNRAKVESAEDSFALGLGASRRWLDGLSTTFNVRHTKGTNGAEDFYLTAFLTWVFPNEHQFVTATTSSASNSSQLDWSYQPGGTGSVAAKADIKNQPGGSGYGGSLDYTGNRARIGLAENINFTKADTTSNPPTKAKSTQNTGLTIGTALVFAGGHFAVSRPVTDSFVIFAPLPNLKDQNILVNPQKDGNYVAETDWLGSAVNPELPSYSLSALTLRQKDWTQGVGLPQDHFVIKPKYHSGYGIDIGTDATVYLRVLIQNQDGTPGSMIAAQAFYLDDPSKEPVTVFTNRNGLIRSEGFRYGKYRIDLGDDYEGIEFTIPDSTKDTFDLGVMKLKARRK